MTNIRNFATQKLLYFFLIKCVVLITFTKIKSHKMSQTILSLKDVTIYQDHNAILANVNLDVKHGEFLYVIGKTGSGKSSFMKTLYADLPLTEGTGTILDYDLNSLKEIDIRYINDIPGYFSIKITDRYTHVSKEKLIQINSPLDDLNL